MRTLLVGNTGYITNDFIEEAFPEKHVFILGESKLKTDRRKKRIVRPFPESEDETEDIFHTYEFEEIVYFSNYLTFHGELEGEAEMLRKVLQYCKGRDKVHIVYLTGPDGSYDVSTGKTLLVSGAEEMCVRYASLAGASAISCLTEPFYFQGSDQYLWEIASEVDIPVLRKDFVIDDYMILQAAAYGAAAVLLICALLDDKQLREYREMAEDLGMDALVEAHDAEEVERALKSGARIIGVNNRDLKTFEVDMANSIKLRKLAPDDVIFVSESGIRTAEDIQRLHDNRIEAVLIGETLMRSPDKKAALEELNGGPLTEA